MLPLRKLPLSFALFGLAFAASRAEAALIVDTFDTPVSPGSSCTGITNCTDTRSNIGDFSATRQLQTSEATASINHDVPGAFFYDDSNGTHSFTLTYTLGGKDVTGGDPSAELLIHVLSTTITATDFNVTLKDTGAGNTTKSFNLAPNSNFDLALPLTDWTGVNLASVQTIELTLGNHTGNLSLDVVQVPEPSTAGMFFVGLLGLARAGRRPRAAA